MGKSLKEKNQPQLISFVLVNALGLGLLLLGINQVPIMIIGVLNGNVASIGRLVTIPAALAVVLGILSWAVPRNWKEVLVFWRTGKNCLPSSRAFTVIANDDPRINVQRLAEKLGPLPSDPARQTVVWYGVYRKHAEDASVQDAHCAYLRYREMTALSGSIVISFVVASLWAHLSIFTLLIGISLVVAEYFLLLLAARNAAVHFVANVLALESVGEGRSLLL